MPAQPGNQVIAFPNRLKANATCQPEMGDDAASPHSQLNDFRSAMDTLEIGVAGWNAEGKLTLANTCFADLFGLSREQAAPGLPLRDFTDLAAASGVLDHSDSALLYSSFVNAFSVGEATSFVEPLSNGTHLCFTFRPMDSGGWLTTYEDVTARDRAQERLHYAATHDALTSVANRALLNEKLAALTQRGIPCAVVCLDLDRFKTVNDAIGHAGGDKLLKAVAQRLAAGHRQGDVIARLGGDEFVVVLVSIQTEADAALAAERLIKMVSEAYVHEGNSISIGTSVGIALSPHDGRDAATLLQRADKALNTAKQAGKGTFRFFDKELEFRLREMDELERDLRMALPNGEIEMYYQPQVRCSTGRVAGFEALMRWRHPLHGMVSPARFIPVAEAGGMICALGDFAIQRACRDAATWPAHLKIAVNLSPAQLRVGDVVATTAAALAMSGLEPSRLELEVTETVLIDDIEATRGILRALKDFGVRISMDDFGTGYSSLSYIQQMPFDKIKIDKSFVDGMGNGPGPDAVVQAVIDIAEKLGIETVAEGVETCDQYETLAARGCDLVQGFLFSKPMPEQRVRRIVEVIDGCMASRNRLLTMTGQPGTIKPDMHDPV